MKKRIVLLMCTVLTICSVGCSRADDTAENTNEVVTLEETIETEEAVVVDVANAVELLTSVWDTYEDADKFAIGGGDSENMTMDVAGAFDVSKVEELDTMLGFPKDSVSAIDDAASMMHMMNANTFTSGAYHLTDAASKQALADALKDNIMNRQWMCGFPDTLLIVSVGDEYMVSAFGEAQIMENFKTKLLAQYEVAEVMYEESLAE